MIQVIQVHLSSNILATYRSLAHTNIRALCPSRKTLIALIRRLLSLFNCSIVLFVLICVLCWGISMYVRVSSMPSCSFATICLVFPVQRWQKPSGNISGTVSSSPRFLSPMNRHEDRVILNPTTPIVFEIVHQGSFHRRFPAAVSFYNGSSKGSPLLSFGTHSFSSPEVVESFVYNDWSSNPDGRWEIHFWGIDQFEFLNKQCIERLLYTAMDNIYHMPLYSVLI